MDPANDAAAQGLNGRDCPIASSPSVPRDSPAGVAFALGAFSCWGFFPVYWKLLDHVPALELLAHRTLWSLGFVAVILVASRRLGEVAAALRSRAVVRGLLLSTLLLAPNWLVYVWAVNAGHILETSLGYFINPLVNILLGSLVLHERLRPWQKAAVGLAAAGVILRTVAVGAPPWIGLFLAVSFALYGLVRKVTPVGAMAGLAVETAIVAPLAGGFLVWLAVRGQGAFATQDAGVDLLLAGTGIVTAIPLMFFAAAARRIRLSTVGICQYLAPSIQFVLAIAFYGETAGGLDLAAFGLIWTALALYTLDARRAGR